MKSRRLMAPFTRKAYHQRLRSASQQILAADVRFGSKADVTLLNFDVRFAPESGHSAAAI
jgi:hypothetical protein